MWNSRKVGEWIERRTGKVVSQKKQRGWEYLKRLGNSPKVPRPHHEKANNSEQEAFKKAPDEDGSSQGSLPEVYVLGFLLCEEGVHRPSVGQIQLLPSPHEQVLKTALLKAPQDC
jgi:hypothetical protein